MKPRTTGEIGQGLPDVIHKETMLSEEEERDKSETDCKNYELMLSGPKNEEVINETVREFVLEQQSNDLVQPEPIIPIKLETSDEQCICSEVGVVLSKSGTVEIIKLKDKSENPGEFSEKCEIERSKVKYYFTEFDEVLRRKAIVVLERCALPSSSPGALKKDNKLKNETDNENSFSVTTEGEKQKKRAKVRETLEQREKRVPKPIERFQINYNLKRAEEKRKQLDERYAAVYRRRALERETPEQRDERIEKQIERYRRLKVNETPEQREKRLAAGAERYRKAKEREKPEQREKRLAADAERHRHLKERETPEQRKKRMEKLKERNRRLRANETPEQRKKRLAVKAEWKRKARERETPEQRKKRLAAEAEYIRQWKKRETVEQREKRLAAVAVRTKNAKERETSEERKKRLAVMAERKKKAKERETSQEREKRLERQNERYRRLKVKETPEQREKRLAAVAEYQKKMKERETSDEREERLERQNEGYRRYKAKETPEHREKRLAAAAEHQRKMTKRETPEQREKRLAAAAEYQKKMKERETPEQREKRLADVREYRRKLKKSQKEAIEKDLQLEKRRLAVAKRFKTVIKSKSTDINEDEISEPVDEDGNIIMEKNEVAKDEDFSSEGFEEGIQSLEVVDGGEAVNFEPQYVKENFIKSEAAAASAVEEEKDEIGIDFEAYMETKINVEPI